MVRESLIFRRTSSFFYQSLDSQDSKNDVRNSATLVESKIKSKNVRIVSNECDSVFFIDSKSIAQVKWTMATRLIFLFEYLIPQMNFTRLYRKKSAYLLKSLQHDVMV